MAKKSKKKNKLSVSFKDVKTFKLLPEMDFLTEVQSITQEEGSEHDYLQWNLSVVLPTKFKGSLLSYNTSLAPQALWNLRNVLEALGVEVPDDEMELELDDYIGMKLGVTNEHRVYEQKKRNDIVDIFSEENYGKTEDSEEDEEDEEEKPSKKNKKKSKVVEEDDEEEKSSKKNKKNKKPKPEEDEDEEDESEAEEDDGEEGEGGDDEEDEKQKYARSDVLAKDSDELDEVIEEAQLDEDLKDISKIKKKRKAVLAALEEEDLLEEEDDEEDDD